jgi:hypothetical protein
MEVLLVSEKGGAAAPFLGWMNGGGVEAGALRHSAGSDQHYPAAMGG